MHNEHLLPESKAFFVILPAVIEAGCDCGDGTPVEGKYVLIDTDDDRGPRDQATLQGIVADEWAVQLVNRPATVMVESADGSLRLKDQPDTRYFPSFDSFGANVLGIAVDHTR